MEKDEPTLYEMYREPMYHYYICLDVHPSRENMISLNPWVEYLFPIADGPVENIQALVSERKIAQAMKVRNHEDVVLEEDDGVYERGDVFLSSTARLQGRSPGKRYWLAICQQG